MNPTILLPETKVCAEQIILFLKILAEKHALYTDIKHISEKIPNGLQLWW